MGGLKLPSVHISYLVQVSALSTCLFHYWDHRGDSGGARAGQVHSGEPQEIEQEPGVMEAWGLPREPLECA